MSPRSHGYMREQTTPGNSPLPEGQLDYVVQKCTGHGMESIVDCIRRNSRYCRLYNFGSVIFGREPARARNSHTQGEWRVAVAGGMDLSITTPIRETSRCTYR